MREGKSGAPIRGSFGRVGPVPSVDAGREGMAPVIGPAGFAPGNKDVSPSHNLVVGLMDWVGSRVVLPVAPQRRDAGSDE